MKIYSAHSTNKMLGRLGAHLIVYNKPFVFDGYTIEFPATEKFLQKLYRLDPMLEQIEFVIYNS